MDSPPLNHNKPKSALPSYLTSASSPLSISQEARAQKEREKLYASIESSNTAREPVDLDAPNGYFSKKNPSRPEMNGHATRAAVGEEPARDHRDEAPDPLSLLSRPASPFTQNPTIDFDGLSWPSMVLPCSFAQEESLTK